MLFLPAEQIVQTHQVHGRRKKESKRSFSCVTAITTHIGKNMKFRDRQRNAPFILQTDRRIHAEKLNTDVFLSADGARG